MSTPEMGCSGITKTGMLWLEKTSHFLKCREEVWMLGKMNGGWHLARKAGVKETNMQV